MIKGGGAERLARPVIIPILNSAIAATVGNVSRCLSKRFEQSSQNLRLVHACQRNRSIFAPHSEQKFGRYIVESPAKKVVRSLPKHETGRESQVQYREDRRLIEVIAGV